MSNDIYKEEHGLHIHVVSGQQILLLPLLGCVCRSDAATIYDFPIDTSLLGEKVLSYFEQMDHQSLKFRLKYKNYWLIPKGITSWKKFESSTLTLLILQKGSRLNFFRYHLVPDGGFTPESTTPNFDLSQSVSPAELGAAILYQFEIIRQADSIVSRDNGAVLP